MVWRLLSFWECLFSGATSVSGRVDLNISSKKLTQHVQGSRGQWDPVVVGDQSWMLRSMGQFSPSEN